MNERLYKMTISLNVLDHLGIGLYSNPAAVLSEIVANAWDADATQVTIDFNSEQKTITVTDNGIGMNYWDVNNKFLMVGYRKRDSLNDGVTESGRLPMGRKGIGKLSVFSIAEEVEVHTVKGASRNALKMRVADIQETIRRAGAAQEDDSETDASNSPTTYRPTPLPTTSIDFEHGTRIILRSTGRKRFDITAEALRSRLARRFRILGAKHNFRVIIDGSEVTEADSDQYDSFESVWYFGKESEGIKGLCRPGTQFYELEADVDEDKGWFLKGYIATVREQEDLKGESPYISVFARGKLIQEDILAEFKEGRIFSKYLVGRLDAEFLDIDDEEDIVTSDRQRVKEDDRTAALRSFLKSKLTTIGTQWSNMRGNKGVDRAKSIPAIKEWFYGLKGDTKKAAEKMFAKIETLGLPGKGRKELYKQSILAFEKFAINDLLSRLDQIQDAGQFELLTQVFGEIDELEAAHYFQIVRSRLEVLRKFEHVVEKEKEKVIQHHLFEHLWLLDPSWERASTNERIEQSVTREFAKVTDKLSEEQRAGRIDIRYQTAAGKHIVIELKKYDVKVSLDDLRAQLAKYRGALQECLASEFPDDQQQIELIAILGSPPTHQTRDADEVEVTLRAIQARYITYDTLIKQTQESYADYLEANRKIGAVAQLLNDIDSQIQDA